MLKADSSQIQAHGSPATSITMFLARPGGLLCTGYVAASLCLHQVALPAILVLSFQAASNSPYSRPPLTCPLGHPLPLASSLCTTAPSLRPMALCPMLDLLR